MIRGPCDTGKGTDGVRAARGSFQTQMRAAVTKFSERDTPSPTLARLLAEWRAIIKELDGA